jgi:hypothetical protein
MRKGYWLNTTKVVNPDVKKPCVKLKYCPYGGLVEEFSFSTLPKDANKGKYSPLSCADVNGAIIQFGHDCPVHYLAEFVK